MRRRNSELEQVYEIGLTTKAFIIGIAFYRNYHGLGPDEKLRNNIFLMSRLYHINWGSGASNYIIDSDYNLFFPSLGKTMHHATQGGALTLNEWQAISIPDCTFDPNSKGIYFCFQHPYQLISFLNGIIPSWMREQIKILNKNN